MSFDVEAIRKDFMILRRQVNGKPLVYLDSAASAQKPNAVVEAMAGAMLGSYANVHRGLHTLANETTEAFEGARAAVAQFIGAPFVDCVVFTKGATQSINIVASGIDIAPGDEIVLSVMEHHANIVPWHFLRERKGAVLRWVDIDDDGMLDLEDLERQIGPRTKMVALTHMSNVLGARLRAAEAIRIARSKGTPVLLDGCQMVVHDPVDVGALDPDYYVFSGHKLYGPTGIGVLYGKPERLDRLRPFEGGGEMIETVSLTHVTYNDPPHRFEAGTPPILEAIGLRAAIDWLSAQDRAAIAAHEKAMHDRLVDALRTLNGVRVYGAAPDKGAIVAFNVEGAHPHDVAQIVDREGVAIRAGHHCAQPLMTRLGVHATARASLALYTNEHDIDVFIAALGKARKLLA
ncbi:MAG: cysteine desulfurase [Hyphomonadaceae bacterium]|nr:cysteine desulfurase [Hyphomonadaceae bacterium]